MIKIFLKNDERGAITVDWVALTAGILLLGIIVVYGIMNDSADNLFSQFDLLNENYKANAEKVTTLASQTVTIGQ